MEPKLEKLVPLIDKEIARVKELVVKRSEVESEDFDLRGGLYKLAFEVAPNARQQDLDYLKKWIKPQEGEKSIDIGAGTGFVSAPLASWTNTLVYAIDPSDVQLKNLENKKGEHNIKTIAGSLAEDGVLKQISEDIGKISIITSYGGIHHAISRELEQREIFENASKVLKKGGRFVAGDVGDDTLLSQHFEKSVKKHCLTGHEEKWLNKERLETELTDETGLKLIKAENVPVKWVFSSERQMALFMKCLHAYDMTEEEILKDLKDILGYAQNQKGDFELNWPMLFFHLEKQ